MSWGADEGFGPRGIEALSETVALPPSVRLLDGGTQGLYLFSGKRPTR